MTQSPKYRYGRPIGAGGFTMVELMVALAIGLFILAVLANLFMTTRSTGVLQEELSRVQEAGRFATEFLAYDVRMAGYAGCRANLTAGTPTGSPPTMTCDPGTVCTIVSDKTNIPSVFNPAGMTGHAYTGTGGATAGDWTPALPTTFFPTSGFMPKPFTDVLIIQRASSLGTHLTGNPVPDNDNIQVQATAELAGQIQRGDVLMVSDCKSADVFMANAVSSSGGKITITHDSSKNDNQGKLTHSYGDDAELFKLVSRAYYIRNNTTNVPALFRRELTSQSNAAIVADQEMVEGVEFMLVGYGIDADGNNVPELFTRANSVTDWRQVILARVGLLVRTAGNVEMSTDTNTYNLADDSSDSTFTVPAAQISDQRRRQVFTMMVQRRN